jgi:hypothetical protein
MPGLVDVCVQVVEDYQALQHASDHEANSSKIDCELSV